MSGELDLDVLLKNIKPILHDGEYVFLTTDLTMVEAAEYNPIGLFHEPEGLTILIQAPAPPSLSSDPQPLFKMITLSVHSSLEAVGFLAAVAQKLAAGGISVNPVAGFYHDHLFVPASRAQDAMEIIQTFSEA